jgi:hypothetical protein
LLRASAQQLLPHPHLEAVERLARRGLLPKFVGIKLSNVPDSTHQRNSINNLAVRVVVFEPDAVNHDVLPAGESAAGGLVRSLPQCSFS